MKKYLKNNLATGVIEIHRDGTATLKVSVGAKRVHNKLHSNEKAAMQAWYRLNN